MVAVPAIIIGNSGKGQLAGSSSLDDGGAFNAFFAMAQENAAHASQGLLANLGGEAKAVKTVVPSSFKPTEEALKALLLRQSGRDAIVPASVKPIEEAMQSVVRENAAHGSDVLLAHLSREDEAAAGTKSSVVASANKNVAIAVANSFGRGKQNIRLNEEGAQPAQPLAAINQIIHPVQPANENSLERARDDDEPGVYQSAHKSAALWQPDADSDLVNIRYGAEEESSILSKEQGLVSLFNPLLEFFKELKSQNPAEGSLILSDDNKEKMEALLLNSGYSALEVEALFDASAQNQGNIDLLALGQLVMENPPSGGQAFILKHEDRPLFAQVMRDLGISSSEVEQYLNSAPSQGNAYILRDIAGLLAQARTEPAIGREGVADRARLQDLLQKLGLNRREVQALLNSAPKAGNEVNAKSMFVMLEAAAQKQDLGITQALKDLAARSQVETTDTTDARDADRLRAHMIQALQAMENRVSQQKTEPGQQPLSVFEPVKNSGVHIQEAPQAPNPQGQNQAGAQERVQHVALDGHKGGQNGRSGEESGQRGEGNNQAPVWGAAAKNSSAKTDVKAGLAGIQSADTPTAGRAASAASATNVLPAYLVRQVAFNMAQMANQGLNTLRMQLKPPSMGEISMSLTVKDGAIKASMVADTVAAKQALESGMEQLKQQLALQGLRIEQINISVQPDAQRRHESAQADQKNHNQRRQHNEDGSAEDKPEEAKASQPGRLSVVA